MNQVGIPNLDKKLEASLIADMKKVEDLKVAEYIATHDNMKFNPMMFEAAEEAIAEAMRKGKFVYDVSGSAR